MNKIRQFVSLFGILITSFSATIAQTTIPQGLVAYYPFNGNANDVSGNNLNAIVTGATLTSNRRGEYNSAYNFAFKNIWGYLQNDEVVQSYIKCYKYYCVSMGLSSDVSSRWFNDFK